jgi:hypothetical protein
MIGLMYINFVCFSGRVRRIGRRQRGNVGRAKNDVCFALKLPWGGRIKEEEEEGFSDESNNCQYFSLYWTQYFLVHNRRG